MVKSIPTHAGNVNMRGKKSMMMRCRCCTCTDLRQTYIEKEHKKQIRDAKANLANVVIATD